MAAIMCKDRSELKDIDDNRFAVILRYPVNFKLDRAYHVPDFSSYIFAVSEIDEHVDVKFSRHFCPYQDCFMFRLSSEQLVFEIHCSDGLYRMKILRPNNLATHRARATDNVAMAKEWHERTGHMSVDRMLELSEHDSSIPRFTRETLAKLFCIPCLQAKSRKAHAKSVEPRASSPLKEVHADTSSPLHPGCNGVTYVAHFIDSLIAKSDVSLLQKRSEFSEAFRLYKSIAENHFSQQACKISALRIGNASELKKGETAVLCREAEMKVTPAPAYASRATEKPRNWCRSTRAEPERCICSKSRLFFLNGSHQPCKLVKK